MSQFDYILDKINSTPFSEEPFRHLYIEDFFEEDQFQEIVDAPEVKLKTVETDDQLIEELHGHNYKSITFPGTVRDVDTYLKWHKDRQNQKNLNQDTCEGFGITFRLQKTLGESILQDIANFFKSPTFWECLARKFELSLENTTTDTGLQKYLDGYEISPHPDIRRKALTFMVNINPAEGSESIQYHTQYLKFKPEKDHIRSFWNQHPDVDRCWVPWEWCDTHKQQTRNNTIVIFSPSNDTLHAIKASYNHLATQRTQYYGNLWYKESPAKSASQWRDYV